MDRKALISQIERKGSLLCVGLDTDIQKIPTSLRALPDPVFEFNKRIIDATIDYAIAYKPNMAFYESMGAAGWESLQKTMNYMPEDVFLIADAKRGDIGNTSSLYAKAFFEQMKFDAITVAPYMGEDSVKPFLKFKDKWVILLGLTSNPGSLDFQQLPVGDGSEKLFECVIRKSREWGDSSNLMYVIGATQTDHLAQIRTAIPDHFLLVPGIGAQGGSLNDVCKYGLNSDFGLIINSSRSIIYASSDASFELAVRREAMKLRNEMKECMDKYL